MQRTAQRAPTERALAHTSARLFVLCVGAPQRTDRPVLAAREHLIRRERHARAGTRCLRQRRIPARAAMACRRTNVGMDPPGHRARMRGAPIGPQGCGRCSLSHVLRSHRRIVLSLEHVTNVSFAALHTRLFTRLFTRLGLAWKGNATLLSNSCSLALEQMWARYSTTRYQCTAVVRLRHSESRRHWPGFGLAEPHGRWARHWPGRSVLPPH